MVRVAKRRTTTRRTTTRRTVTTRNRFFRPKVVRRFVDEPGAKGPNPVVSGSKEFVTSQKLIWKIGQRLNRVQAMSLVVFREEGDTDASHKLLAKSHRMKTHVWKLKEFIRDSLGVNRHELENLYNTSRDYRDYLENFEPKTRRSKAKITHIMHNLDVIIDKYCKQIVRLNKIHV